MHRFTYKRNELLCERVRVRDIAATHATPFYLYSKGTLIDHYETIRVAFRTRKPLICFSVKANSNLAVLKTLVSRGSGLDIVSGGEFMYLRLAKKGPVHTLGIIQEHHTG